MHANESSAAVAHPSQPAWLTVVTISYRHEHPAGYCSWITPAAGGGFSAFVEISGLVRLHAPEAFSSLVLAQAWCLDEQRYDELMQLD